MNSRGLADRSRAFWDRNPCDGQDGLGHRMAFRYGKEPWLPDVLDRVAGSENVIEVGCGQGTDALYTCGRMRPGGSYLALDQSAESLRVARRAREEARASLRVVPQFMQGDGEHLPFADGTFDCAISIGVLHHTPDTAAGIREVLRVLRPGGRATVALYRAASPKLLAANGLRFVTGVADRLLGRPGAVCDIVRGHNCIRLGTMILEATGVPILRSYGLRGIERLFVDFENVRIRPVGLGLPIPARLIAFDRRPHLLGALWLVTGRRPANGR